MTISARDPELEQALATTVAFRNKTGGADTLTAGAGAGQTMLEVLRANGVPANTVLTYRDGQVVVVDRSRFHATAMALAHSLDGRADAERIATRAALYSDRPVERDFARRFPAAMVAAGRAGRIAESGTRRTEGTGVA